RCLLWQAVRETARRRGGAGLGGAGLGSAFGVLLTSSMLSSCLVPPPECERCADSDAALDVASSDSVREPSTHDVEPSASAPGSAPPSTPSCAQLTEASPRTSTATRSSSATSP